MLMYKLVAFLLFAAAACSIQLVMHARHAHNMTAELDQTQPQHRRVRASKATATGGPNCHDLHLGFDYPELRPLKQQLETLICASPSTADIPAAYASILGLHSPCHAPNPVRPTSHLASFLTAAQQLLGPHSLRRCSLDPSLLEELHLASCQQATGHPEDPHDTTSQQQPYSSSPLGGAANTSVTTQRWLLAANLHNSGHMLPNFVAQTLQLALLMPPGALGVSLYESGSSDLTRFWITLLHLLLLPLGTPHHFVTGGTLKPTQGLPRIQLMAALRNAALEPVLTTPHNPHTASSGSASSSSSSSATGWLGGKQRGTGTANRRPPGGTPQQVLSHHMAGFQPEYIAFSNDVFLCAGDVLRLAAHRADLSCGMDFYVGPWEAGPGLHWAPAAAQEGAQHQHQHQHQQQHQQQQEDEEEVEGPGVVSGAPDGGSGSSSRGGRPVGAADPAPQQLRFYDKWVARDIRGGLLSNTPPYLLHPGTQQQLARGLPVPMYCCWNGLAVLRAAPLVSRSITFRSHVPGECAASECSLLCDDLHAAGYHHVVMDPAVQLTYDADQMSLLGQDTQLLQQQRRRRQRWRQAARKRRRHLLQPGDTSMAAHMAEGSTLPVPDMQQAHHGGSSSSGGGGAPSRYQQRLPQLPWSQVAAAAGAVKEACRTAATAALAARLQEDPAGAAAAQADGWRWVECCDLQPGHSYVNFTAHCHPVDVVARWGVAAAGGP